MFVKIINTATAATCEKGIATKVYEKDEVHEVHQDLGQVLINAGIAKEIVEAEETEESEEEKSEAEDKNFDPSKVKRRSNK